jgi:hypothetical protein
MLFIELHVTRIIDEINAPGKDGKDQGGRKDEQKFRQLEKIMRKNERGEDRDVLYPLPRPQRDQDIPHLGLLVKIYAHAIGRRNDVYPRLP